EGLGRLGHQRLVKRSRGPPATPVDRRFRTCRKRRFAAMMERMFAYRSEVAVDGRPAPSANFESKSTTRGRGCGESRTTRPHRLWTSGRFGFGETVVPGRANCRQPGAAARREG